jgi:hypothetical protein
MYLDLAAAMLALDADRQHSDALLLDLHRELRDEHRAGASSNDMIQHVDDWFTQHGHPTIIYAD